MVGETQSSASGIEDVSFRPMSAAAAARLGPAFAAIDPWAHYHYRGDALAAYLAGQEEGAPRNEIALGDEIAGAIGIRKNWLRGPYLQFLGILPPYQKRGLGAAALSWLESLATREKSQNVWVVASAFNAGALSFYEHFGFVRVATLDGLVADGTDEVLLRKRLARR